MSAIHLLVQGKGGVGKSLTATILAQYIAEQTADLKCYDTDPVNRTFKGFKSLNVKAIDLLDKDRNIDTRTFDDLIEDIAESPSTTFVVDNGASTFIPLSSYMLENDVAKMLTDDLGRELVLHVPIMGGQSFLDTMAGLDSILKYYPTTVKIVVWLNEKDGLIEVEGKSFEQMKIYTGNKTRITGIITIPRKTESTFVVDIKNMLTDRLTFDEAIASPAYKIMSKQRLKTFKTLIFNQLKAQPLLSIEPAKKAV